MDVSILNEQLEDERRTVAQLQKKLKDYQVRNRVFNLHRPDIVVR